MFAQPVCFDYSAQQQQMMATLHYTEETTSLYNSMQNTDNYFQIDLVWYLASLFFDYI